MCVVCLLVMDWVGVVLFGLGVFVSWWWCGW